MLINKKFSKISNCGISIGVCLKFKRMELYQLKEINLTMFD